MPFCRTLVLAVVPALSWSAAAQQVSVNAGPNQQLPAGHNMTRLAGQLLNPSPVDFWVADGDGANEDKLMKWNDVTGLTAVGPLKNAGGQLYGWPSDLERVQGIVYGLETFHRRLYILDATTGLCTDAGPALSYTRLFGMSYDSTHNKLYAVDQKTRKLLELDRSNALPTVVTTLPAAHSDIRGLAYRAADDKIYYCDNATETLQRIDPVTKVIEHVLDLNDGPDAIVDEIEFWEGELFCSYRSYDTNTDIWSAQLARIDLEEEIAIPYGPVIQDVSAHSFVLHSLPEITRWVQVGGPPDATIARPWDLDTPVSFARPGRYVFELRAQNFRHVKATDTMIVVVSQIGWGGNSGPQSAQ
jgi:hypothetical protein